MLPLTATLCSLSSAAGLRERAAESSLHQGPLIMTSGSEQFEQLCAGAEATFKSDKHKEKVFLRNNIPLKAIKYLVSIGKNPNLPCLFKEQNCCELNRTDTFRY